MDWPSRCQCLLRREMPFPAQTPTAVPKGPLITDTRVGTRPPCYFLAHRSPLYSPSCVLDARTSMFPFHGS